MLIPREPTGWHVPEALRRAWSSDLAIHHAHRCALGVPPDRYSRIADPQFVDAAEHDFRLRPGSPALKLGFRPIDTSRVGLYGDPAWVEETRRVKHPKTVFPPPPSPP